MRLLREGFGRAMACSAAPSAPEVCAHLALMRRRMDVGCASGPKVDYA